MRKILALWGRFLGWVLGVKPTPPPRSLSSDSGQLARSTPPPPPTPVVSGGNGGNKAHTTTQQSRRVAVPPRSGTASQMFLQAAQSNGRDGNRVVINKHNPETDGVLPTYHEVTAETLGEQPKPFKLSVRKYLGQTGGIQRFLCVDPSNEQELYELLLVVGYEALDEEGLAAARRSAERGRYVSSRLGGESTGVLPVLAVGTHYGEQRERRTFLVRPHVGGWRLSTLRELAMPLPQLMSVLKGACDVLAQAHEHKEVFVHAALTPENLVLGKDGRVWIWGWESAFFEGRTMRTLTRFAEREAVFLAPEQVRGVEGAYAPPTSATDVFTMGILMLFVITGQSVLTQKAQTAFVRWDREQVDAMLHLLPGKVKQSHPEVGDELQTLLERCLALEPTNRIGMRELSDRIATIGSNHHRWWNSTSLKDWATAQTAVDAAR